MVRIKPGSDYFVGRRAIANRLLEATRRTNAVLLFGGRQAGKTSLLLEVRKQLAITQANVGHLVGLDVPVYVDLTSLPYDAQPSDFFGYLATRAAMACREQISGFTLREQRECRSVEDFADALGRLRQAGGEVDIRLVFLLDEAKRVLAERFPRGFQDNLFTLLFGQLADVANSVMVFAGAQHLMDFYKDDTSPLGSRAIPVVLSNLEQQAIADLARMLLPSSDDMQIETIVETAWEETGGHAGLVARFMERVDGAGDTSMLTSTANSVAEECAGLFYIWIKSLTPEAQVLAPMLVSRGSIDIREAAVLLAENGLSRFSTRPAFDELAYTGIAIPDGERVRRCNKMFWMYFATLVPQESRPRDGEKVWSLIEETELALRQLISTRLAAKYGGQYTEVMKRILGEKAWASISATKDKSERQYKFSRNPSARDPLSCMYLGQLGTLMISNETWDLFKKPFRDKRELEDKLAAIAPVRNDRAHFCTVPEKELGRCRIACDDLLVIVEREMALSEPGLGGAVR